MVRLLNQIIFIINFVEFTFNVLCLIVIPQSYITSLSQQTYNKDSQILDGNIHSNTSVVKGDYTRQSLVSIFRASWLTIKAWCNQDISLLRSLMYYRHNTRDFFPCERGPVTSCQHLIGLENKEFVIILLWKHNCNIIVT